MSGMEHAIEHAAELLNAEGACCGDCGREPGAPLSECPACERFLTGYARALADSGLLAPAPLREEWHAAHYGVGPDGVRHLRLIGTEGTREHADESRADCSRYDPDTRFFLVRRPVHDWMPVDPADLDGRAEK